MSGPQQAGGSGTLRASALHPSGGRTQILIIDDDRESIRLHRSRLVSAELTVTPAPGRSNGNGNGHHVPEWDGATVPRIEGDVLVMDPELVCDALARAHQLLTQTTGKTDEAERMASSSADDGIAIDLPMQMVYRAGRPVRVTPTEFRLLLALMRRRGAVVSRDDLRRDVWPEKAVQARVIDTHVARLRRKLEDDSRQPRHILTALAAGYRFRA